MGCAGSHSGSCSTIAVGWERGSSTACDLSCISIAMMGASAASSCTWVMDVEWMAWAITGAVAAGSLFADEPVLLEACCHGRAAAAWTADRIGAGCCVAADCALRLAAASAAAGLRKSRRGRLLVLKNEQAEVECPVSSHRLQMIGADCRQAAAWCSNE
jgi:hypothetical protein